ncbi:MAG TPA: AMP-binding protein, partial [Puia sp.]|nr:AMP-binding protein [Puia sp.]
MMEPKRLFDCLELHLEKDPLPDMLAAKENGTWKAYSTTEIAAIIQKLSTGLLRLGVSGGDRSVEGIDKVAIISKNRPEWIMVDLAVQLTGAVLAPIYPTISPFELEFILNDAKVKYVFVNDQDLYHKVTELRDKLPSLLGIFTFEPVKNVPHWKELLTDPTAEEAERLAVIQKKIGENDLATVIYTSGTTGTPKGVMLSHRNILTNVQACITCLPQGTRKALSFLPLNHIYERMLSYLYLFS